ncbi:5-formyltetrahydrofolate cyclo-ligase [Maribacter algicola]|uniref:5-formyltetrahydrofolate cyclo-ligase n=1 Tax=Meishania litoralis TaxID=3434685 RepID=A0ACC7LIJ1_9FLAO
MLKRDLRIRYSQLRNSLAPQELLNFSLSIANKLLELPIWSFDYYHLFLPISKKKEIDTTFILSILQGKDKNIVLPKVGSNGNLRHFLLTDATKIKENDWGIPEPVDGIAITPKKIDVVILPLLAFDKKGNRVGYGKGFYDRFLNSCRPEVLKVGLSLFEAEEETIETNRHDVRLDYCVTPKRIYNFSDDSSE